MFFFVLFCFNKSAYKIFPLSQVKKNKQREQETLNSVCLQNVCHGYCQGVMDRSEEYTLEINYVKCEKLHIPKKIY